MCDKEFNIAKNLKYDGYQKALAPVVYKCFDKKSSGRAVTSVRSIAPPSEILAAQDKQNKSSIDSKIRSNQ